VHSGGWQLDVLWPPVVSPGANDNERSLVVRAGSAGGTVLVTSDIGVATEQALAARRDLRCDVLIVPHHGSRTSTSAALLAGASPSVALVPAGPHNTHHHPSASVTDRLRQARVAYRLPLRDGWCGATPQGDRWRAWP
jgi:competence protein ComEC